MGDATTSVQHVLAELERLDVLLRVQVWRARQRHDQRADDLAAFYIPETEPDALLDKALGTPIWATVPLPAELLEGVQARLDRMAEEVAERRAASLAQGVPLRLV